MTRQANDVARVRSLAGRPVQEIVRVTGVPRSTVQRWLSDPPAGRATCMRCDPDEHRLPDVAAYVYLLGLYLGDGTITVTRGVPRLHIYQDEAYPDLITRCIETIGRVVSNRVWVRQRRGSVDITAYSSHWSCLLPQHGPGRKHERPIELDAWQCELVAADRRPLVEGLFHSDGCRFTNRVRSGAGRTYEYPRYSFSNRSDDIHLILTDSLDALDIRWTRTNRWTTSVSRRPDVELLDSFIARKS